MSGPIPSFLQNHGATNELQRSMADHQVSRPPVSRYRRTVQAAPSSNEFENKLNEVQKKYNAKSRDYEQLIKSLVTLTSKFNHITSCLDEVVFDENQQLLSKNLSQLHQNLVRDLQKTTNIAPQVLQAIEAVDYNRFNPDSKPETYNVDL